MEPIKISRTDDSLSKVYFNGQEISAIVFNGTIIWPATITPNLERHIDESLDIEYNEFEELL